MAESYADVRDGRVYNLALAEADYADLMGWIPAGNARIGDTWDGKEFLAPVVIPSVPVSVTSRQAKRALLDAGLLDDVEDAIAAIPDKLERRRVQIDWIEAQDFRRDWPVLVSLAKSLGLDSAALDALFIEAKNL